MNQKKKNLLVFGYGLAVIIPSLVFLHGRKHGMGIISFVLLIFSVTILLITVVNYQYLKGFYEKWMLAAHFIGKIVTTLLLTILFYGVFAPVGLILRLMRKDLLEQLFDPKANSYWHKHPSSQFDRTPYTRPF